MSSSHKDGRWIIDAGKDAVRTLARGNELRKRPQFIGTVSLTLSAKFTLPVPAGSDEASVQSTRSHSDEPAHIRPFRSACRKQLRRERYLRVRL